MQQHFKILLFFISNKAQHVSGVTTPIIRSLKLHKQPLVLHKTVEGCRTVLYKNKGCFFSFRLLMIGGVSLETW